MLSAVLMSVGLATAAPPVLTVDAPSIDANEGTTAAIGGSYADPEGQDVFLSYSIGTGTGAGGQSVGSNGNWSWLFTVNDGATDSQLVTVTAEDTAGETSQVSFQLNALNVALSIETLGATLSAFN